MKTPKVVLPKTKVVWVWYSLKTSNGKWYRSCWEGPTRQAAIKERKMAYLELDNYTNALVKETTTFRQALLQKTKRKRQ